MAHEHDYRKLSDEAVFCRGCGDIRSVSPPICTLPHFPVYPPVVYPTIPWPRPYWQPYTYPTWTVSSGQTIGNTVVLSDADYNAMSLTGGAS